jgi:hypothetical protein
VCTTDTCVGGNCVGTNNTDPCNAGAGTCRGGSCCGGCWDGDSCEPGTANAFCGSGGAACVDCGVDVCSSGACVPT